MHADGRCGEVRYRGTSNELLLGADGRSGNGSKKGSGTVAQSTRPTFGWCPGVPETVSDPFLNHAANFVDSRPQALCNRQPLHNPYRWLERLSFTVLCDVYRSRPETTLARSVSEADKFFPHLRPLKLHAAFFAGKWAS